MAARIAEPGAAPPAAALPVFARSAILGVLMSLGLVACSALPSVGPSTLTVVNEAPPSGNEFGYAVVDLDEPLVKAVGPWRPHTFAEQFAVKGGARSLVLGIGDTLQIRIMEAGDNGLFANTQTRGVDLTAQIDETGDIFVPFVGRTRAAGRTSEALRASIQASLQDKAIQPQVLIGVTSQQANAVVIVGDVYKPGRFPLNVGGTRLLDAIALAGGSRFPTYETTVVLKRGATSASLLMEDLVLVPGNNVWLRADDEILLAYAPQTYTLLGAVTTQKEIKFETKTVTLAEAIGRGGGLNTQASDPSGIFVFRYEEPSLLKRFRPDAEVGLGGKIPVVYRLDLKQPRGFFMARSMWVRDKDIVYVADAPSVEFMKFITIVNSTLQAVRGGQLVQQGMETRGTNKKTN